MYIVNSIENETIFKSLIEKELNIPYDKYMSLSYEKRDYLIEKENKNKLDNYVYVNVEENERVYLLKATNGACVLDTTGNEVIINLEPAVTKQKIKRKKVSLINIG